MSDQNRYKKRQITVFGEYLWDEASQSYKLVRKESYEYQGPLSKAMTNPNWVSQNWMFRLDDGDLTTASPGGATTYAEDTAVTSGIFPGDKFRVRFNVAEDNSGDATSGNWTLQYQLIGGGGWTNVPTGTPSEGIVFASSGTVADGTNETSQLLSTISATTWQGSWNEFDSNGSLTSRSWSEDWCELEWCMQLSSGTEGNVYQFRVLCPEGVLPDTTPSSDAQLTVDNNTKTLTSTDVQCLSNVTAPVLTETTDNLTSTDVQNLSQVSTPALVNIPRVWLNTSQSKSGAAEMTVTAYSATSITFTDPSGPPTGTDIWLGVENTTSGDLVWTQVTVNSVVDHILTSTDVQSLSNVTAPAIGQEHALTATDVQCVSNVTAPVLTEAAIVLTSTDVESATNVTAPSIAQENALTSTDVQSLSNVTAPALVHIPKVYVNTVASKNGSEVEMTVTSFSATNITYDDPSGAPTGSVFVGVENTRTGLIGWRAVTINAADHVLTSTDVQCLSQVTAPTIAQEHGLTATDVENASNVTQPAIAQEHALTSTDVESASQIAGGTLAQTHVLAATDVENATNVTAPAIAQEHALTATDVQCASNVTAPVLAEEGTDVLTSTDVENATNVTAPVIAQEHALTSTDVQAASNVTAPALTPEATDVLTSTDVENATNVTAPAIAQEHALTATDVQSLSQVSAPALSPEGSNTLTSTDVENATNVTAPTIGQEHALNATDVESASQVSAPQFIGGVGLLSTSVQAASNITVPAIAQTHVLLSVSVTSATNVTTPVIAQEHALASVSVQALSQVTPGYMNASSISRVISMSAVFDPSVTMSAVFDPSSTMTALFDPSHTMTARGETI